MPTQNISWVSSLLNVMDFQISRMVINVNDTSGSGRFMQLSSRLLTTYCTFFSIPSPMNQCAYSLTNNIIYDAILTNTNTNSNRATFFKISPSTAKAGTINQQSRISTGF